MQPKAQLLVVSPDGAILQVAQRYLFALGHAALIARTLREAQRALTRAEVSAVCLDSVLPSGEVERFWRWLCREQERPRPPAILFAPSSVKLVPGALPAFFQPGHDSLVPKPIEGRELARAVERALAAGPRPRPAELLQAGPVALDVVSQELLFAGGGSLSLTPTEFRLVRYLMQRCGEYVAPAELLEQVWGFPAGLGAPELVRAHVSNLRRKLRTMGEDVGLVRTVPYRGYAIVPAGSPLRG